MLGRCRLSLVHSAVRFAKLCATVGAVYTDLVDKEILQHVASAYRHLLAAEARYQFLPHVALPPLRERKLLDQATTLVGNFMASPHSER